LSRGSCSPAQPQSAAQRNTLKIALALNATMFVIEVSAGIIGQSMGLIADGLDMLADASAYAVALLAIGRSSKFKANAAGASGLLLMVLGFAVLVDVARRATSGEPPAGLLMVVVAALALAVNATVLRLLNKYGEGEVHLRASWIFTRADVVANVAVIASGITVLLTGFRALDLAVGAGIGLYVIREAFEIGDARKACKPAPVSQLRPTAHRLLRAPFRGSSCQYDIDWLEHDPVSALLR
jgi:cation diffusion facilitator family transporter